MTVDTELIGVVIGLGVLENLFSFSWFSFVGVGDGTQGPIHTMNVLYHRAILLAQG